MTYPPGHAVGGHVHDWDQVVFAAEGVMRVFARGNVWLVPAGRALWVPAGISHDLVSAGKVTLRTIYLHPGVVTAFGEECAAIEGSSLLRQLIVHAVELGRLRQDDPHERHCMDLMRDLLAPEPGAELGLPLPSDSRGLQAARRMLDEPGEVDDLGDLARRVGASRRTLERVFRRETGLSLGRWRRRLRLLRAVELLEKGAPVGRVALRVGYRSTSAFIARFKELFGVTPGRYGKPGE